MHKYICGNCHNTITVETPCTPCPECGGDSLLDELLASAKAYIDAVELGDNQKALSAHFSLDACIAIIERSKLVS